MQGSVREPQGLQRAQSIAELLGGRDDEVHEHLLGREPYVLARTASPAWLATIVGIRATDGSGARVRSRSTLVPTWRAPHASAGRAHDGRLPAELSR